MKGLESVSGLYSILGRPLFAWIIPGDDQCCDGASGIEETSGGSMMSLVLDCGIKAFAASRWSAVAKQLL